MSSAPVSEKETSVQGEQWQEQAEEFKNLGNAAFKNKEHQQAIEFYGKAISLDPDNHVLYSNRSAAFLAIGDSKSKALGDATKCVELKPDWPKGYVRRGAAEHALGRYAAALETYARGLKLDPRDKALVAGKAAAVAGEEKKNKAEVENAKRERAAAARQEKARLEAVEKEADGMLDGFFSEVASEEEQRHEAERERAAADRKERVQTDKTEKYTKANLGTSEEQVLRLTGPNYKFKNLNPFHVLQLDIDATLEDVKFRYKKLSLLVHPDKNLGVENASEAFDEVKLAYEHLLDDEKREMVTATIEGTRAACGKAHRRLLNKGASEEALEPLEAKMEKAVLKAFADIEMKRRDSEKHLQASQKRERDQAEEVKAKAAAEEAHQAKWTTGTRVDDRIGDWRSFQGGGPQVKNLKNYKQQERGDSKRPKFGAADMEGWRKDWK